MTDRLRIGFAGLGLMGLPMARRLLDAGWPLTVWNRTPAKADRLVQAGAFLADTPRALSEASDLVFLCLMDAGSVEQVVFGPDGIGEAGQGTVVDFTTGHPEAARAFHDRFRAEHGRGWIDAPVSGGAPGAKSGTLTVMAGGNVDEIEQVRPAVAAFAARFTHMGPPGSGQMTKLVNQIISGCTMTIVAEAVAFAEKNGVEATRLADALAGGFADSKPFQIFAPRMATRDHEPRLGATDTMIKDLDMVEGVAQAAGASIPMTQTAISLMRDSAALGEGDLDISTLIRRFE